MQEPPNHRIGVIQGLRALADHLAEHSELPVPLIAEISYHSVGDTDAEQIAEIDRIAKTLGQTAEHTDADHYRVSRMFDSVEYRAVAVLERAMRRYMATTSYRDSIRIDDDEQRGDR
jgi:hypothetical protein